MKWLKVLMLVFLIPVWNVYAGEADVIEVVVIKEAQNTFRFDVTVRHDDAGWNHYADKWDVVAPSGSILGTRKLLHPHVNEQPFTRSLSGVNIPSSIQRVSIRAHDSVHGYGGKVFEIELP